MSGGFAFEHVVFDLDGTLVDSGADLAAAVNHVLGSLAVPSVPLDTLRGYVGDGARMLVQRALGAHQDRLEAALPAFLSRYGAHLLDETRPYPGIPEMLVALGARGIRVSVLTNKPVALSRRILEGLGLLAHFVDVVGGDSLATRKPDPAGIHHLRARTGTPPDRTLLVGDSGIDVRTARAAGVAFCGVAWGLTPESLGAATPARIVTRPADVVTVAERGIAASD